MDSNKWTIFVDETDDGGDCYPVATFDKVEDAIEYRKYIERIDDVYLHIRFSWIPDDANLKHNPVGDV